LSTRHEIRTEGLTWREVDEEVVILDMQASKYFSLNGTGALLWKALAEGAEHRRLVTLLADRFDIDEAIAARDVDAFLERCIDLDIVR
jgi:hypothetical protein